MDTQRERSSIPARGTRRASLVALGAAAFLVGASNAIAQVVTMPKVKPGQTVWVTRQDGTIVMGNVKAVAETGLALRDGNQETSLPLADIQQVETTDSLTNGIIIGVIPTSLLFGLGAGLGASYGSLASGEPDNGGANRAAVVGLVVGAGIGALIGAAIDHAIHGRRVIYRARRNDTAFAIAPMVDPHGARLRVSLRW